MISREELQLAARNHGMPLEALGWDVTPVGLHYLLTHYDVPMVDLDSFRLRVHGHVRDELTLSLDDLRMRTTTTEAVTMECAGNGRALLEPRPVSQPWLREAVGTGEWTGTSLADVLTEACVLDGAVDVVFTGLDRGVEGGTAQAYARALPVAEALRTDVLLAWGLNGQMLPPQHGFPLRLVVPGWYGMTNVKWLTSIEVLNRPFDGYQNAVAYRLRATEDDPGVAVTRMMPRSLMAPPGLPEFMSRRRHLEAGPVTVTGRAWSGWADVESVQFGVDGEWFDAKLGDRGGPYAWRSWSFEWDAVPGEHEVACRCTDAAGNGQPDTPPWNVGGYANNAVQRVAVAVA